MALKPAIGVTISTGSFEQVPNRKCDKKRKYPSRQVLIGITKQLKINLRIS
jgi:hypothetical protein